MGYSKNNRKINKFNFMIKINGKIKLSLKWEGNQSGKKGGRRH